MSARGWLLALAMAVSLSACGPDRPRGINLPEPRMASATLDGVVVEARVLAAGSLTEAMATRYGIDRSPESVLLLVTVRDPQGNAVSAEDVRLQAEAAALNAPLQPLALRRISVDGMTDAIATLPASPPTTLNFRLTIRHGGAGTQLAFAQDVQPL